MNREITKEEKEDQNLVDGIRALIVICVIVWFTSYFRRVINYLGKKEDLPSK